MSPNNLNLPILDNKYPTSFMTEKCLFLSMQSDDEVMQPMESSKDELSACDMAANAAIITNKRKRKRKRKKKKKCKSGENSQPNVESVEINEIKLPDLGKDDALKADDEFTFASKFFIRPIDEELSSENLDWNVDSDDEITENDTSTTAEVWDEVFEMEFGATGLFQSQLLSNSLKFIETKFDEITVSEYSEVNVQIETTKLLKGTRKKIRRANEKWDRLPSISINHDNSQKVKVCIVINFNKFRF